MQQNVIIDLVTFVWGIGFTKNAYSILSTDTFTEDTSKNEDRPELARVSVAERVGIIEGGKSVFVFCILIERLCVT